VPVGTREVHPVRRFAERRGYSVANLEIVRRLGLPVASDLLEHLAGSVRPHWHARYDVSIHRSGVPHELRHSLCEAMNRLSLDAPTGDLELEEESLDPEGYQHFLDHEARLGRLRLTAVAVHRETGVVAAYTNLVLPGGDPRMALQWGTLVVPEHRGHRLGTAVKVANLQALQELDPRRAVVVTQNAEANPWMVSINEELGFEIIEEAMDLKKDL
jgi:GNAT superfamily N-acetyltransferase